MRSDQRKYQRLANVLPYIYDRKIGIIRDVFEEPKQAGSPDYFRYLAISCNTESFGFYENFNTSGGASIDRQHAMAKAIGEGLERYSAAIFKEDEFEITSYRDAPFECIHPSEFSLYNDRQLASPDFLFKKFDEDTLVRWSPVINFKDGTTKYAPISLVYIPYRFNTAIGEAPIAQGISTGLACHCSFEEAAIGGINEVIERDVFTITWQAMITNPIIDIESLPAELKDLVCRFESTGYKVTLLDATNDIGVASVIGVLWGRNDDNVPICVAASTDLNPHTAITSTLDELAHTEKYMLRLLNSGTQFPSGINHDLILSQSDHLNFWSDKRNRINAEFLLNSDLKRDFNLMPNLCTGSPAKDLNILADKIYKTGHKVLLQDITSEDIAGLGLYIIRAIIPGYNPLFMGYKYRSLGGNRLWTVPQKIGYPGINCITGDNPFPHPFP